MERSVVYPNYPVGATYLSRILAQLSAHSKRLPNVDFVSDGIRLEEIETVPTGQDELRDDQAGRQQWTRLNNAKR
jgi:hypothetical protein